MQPLFGFSLTKRVMMWLVLVTLGVIALLLCTSLGDLQPFALHRRAVRSLPKTWTWSCEEERCVRREWPNVTLAWSSLPACRVTCGQASLVWPKPTSTLVLSRQIRSFHLDQLYMTVQPSVDIQTKSLLRDALNLFRANLQALIPEEDVDIPQSTADIVVKIEVLLTRKTAQLFTLHTNESYTLGIKQYIGGQLVALIEADCFFGARHALETLSQLMWWESDEHGRGTFKVLSAATIKDRPQFIYRGIMLDTSRNFIPISELRSTINGMAASKLNTLHLHLTDSQSFSFESPRYPQMSRYGAYSPDKVYSAKDLKELSAFARVRGVRLIPEVDAPAHAAAGWQWGHQEHLGELAVCVNQEPWTSFCGEPPCGQLNPSNNNTYDVLRGIYADLIELTDVTDMIHIGGDEVNMNCWLDSSVVFTAAEKRNPSASFSNKVIEFHNRAYQELRKANNGSAIKNVIVWSTSSIHQEVLKRAFPQDSYIIQEWGPVSWRDTRVHLDLNYRVILSHVTAWYLDCGFGSWKHGHPDPCEPVSTWQTVYSHRPWANYRRQHLKLVLGGEVCLWSEKVDENTVDARLWPRAAALAERLWSDPREVTGGRPVTQDMIVKDATLRLSAFRDRLLTRGVRASVLWPQWCSDNPEACF